ncbi:MAG: hypothetical protein NVSMB15_13420 [Steroidobacteraceae bacterium]
MSPKPSAWAAPGIERAIININGLFPFGIIYSTALIEHLDASPEAGTRCLLRITGANPMRRNPPLDTGDVQDFDAVHACPASSQEPAVPVPECDSVGAPQPEVTEVARPRVFQ